MEKSRHHLDLVLKRLLWLSWTDWPAGGWDKSRETWQASVTVPSLVLSLTSRPACLLLTQPGHSEAMGISEGCVETLLLTTPNWPSQPSHPSEYALSLLLCPTLCHDLHRPLHQIYPQTLCLHWNLGISLHPGISPLEGTSRRVAPASPALLTFTLALQCTLHSQSEGAFYSLKSDHLLPCSKASCGSPPLSE